MTKIFRYGGGDWHAAETRAQDMVFPGEDWERATPESQLVNSTVLEVAVRYLEMETPPGGDGVEELVVIRNGRMIWEGPDIDRLRYVWSANKSFTSCVGPLSGSSRFDQRRL